MELPATSLSLPRALPFPITIQRIHATVGSTVRKTRRLLTYSFIPAKPDEDGNRDRQVREWESPIEGEVGSWAVSEGDVVRDASQPVVQIKEPCTHDVQLNGLCALCGKDLTAVDYTGFSDTSRATISMAHDIGGLTVSLEEAHRLEKATTARLLDAKKLSLIVDLDQTIVHATVDPTVGEWLQDPKNPNYKALEGVKRFKLVDESPATRNKPKKFRKIRIKHVDPSKGEEADDESSEEEEEDEDNGCCWYYIKMRPGLPEFLKRVAEMYEMHVYTMGTRAYASEVCKVIDPDGGLFGMTRKSLQRLFPCDTNMVVIIDDRADVWDGSPHLVKVIPYEFFVGIGDINAAFLPKKKELHPLPKPKADQAAPDSTDTAQSPSPDASSASPAASTSDTSAASLDASEGSPRSTTPSTTPPPSSADANPHHVPEALLAEPTTVSDLLVSSSPDEEVSPAMDEASTVAMEAIHEVIEARPLEKRQKEQHEAHLHLHHHAAGEGGHEKGEVTEREAVGGIAETEEEYEEEAVLKDNDRELDRVFDILSNVRERFYERLDAKGAADVADIIPAMKAQTLRDTHLVFSGLVALGSRPEDSEYWKLARTFGARCSVDLSSSTTHLVANGWGTAKVHSAQRNPQIKIVYPEWLLESVARWTRVPEDAYVLNVPATSSAPGSPIRPDLSGGEEDEDVESIRLDGEADGAETPVTVPDGDLDLADLDWGDAMKEVDDLLLETDDEDTASVVNGGDTTDGESDAGLSATSVPRPPRKRARMSTTTDEATSAPPNTESPLQKRVKTARSRKSGLNRSVSAAALERSAAQAAKDGSSESQSNGSVKSASGRASTAEGNGDGPSAAASVASSSIDSDDEDLLASMAADLEQGWT
ncbi:RNA Polymerase II CTD phosphatase Fcp1 [Rhodotorula toruloides]|uniref:RNA polymerase II subunit A C-terminal domain phosphatase n=1 Tax=Rhodotorula toruloides TaxID=5286 RepID=A0A511KD46_RHOTO|nr:RNA Polymerase II CTD phosphatase Fcp1 [Rhodotorula toruloides]